MALVNYLPKDTQIVEEIDANGNSSYYLVYALSKDLVSEGFTYRYKVDDLAAISDTAGVVGPDVVINVSDDDYSIISGSLDNISEAEYKNSFYFGTYGQLRTVYEQLGQEAQAGAQSYDYLIEALNEEAKTKPWILSTDSKGRYDYLSVVLEAALEGRTARESDFQKTTWWKTHTSNQREQMKAQATDPSSWEKNQKTIRDSIMTQMIAAGIQSYPTAVVDKLVEKYGSGEFTEADVSNSILKLANPRLRYELDTEIQGALAGQTLDVIESTLEIKNTIDRTLGPGASQYYNLEDIANEKQANPNWYTETFLPGLNEQFQTKYTQYSGTNIKRYEDAAPEYRYEWETITGQKADETSGVWKRFMATNDIKEREDIAFQEAARLGTQTYRDKVRRDMDAAFGQAGQRATGGGRYQ
jgi:hypothetical protein